MKKTISLLLASVVVAGIGQAAEDSPHGTEFTTFRDGAHDATQGAAALYRVTTNGTNFIGGAATTYQGF